VADLSKSAAIAQSLIVGFAGTQPDPLLEDLIVNHSIGGVILFARNLQSPSQVWRLNRDLQQIARQSGQPPLFIMVDQEGGSVARLRAPFTHQPEMRLLGQSSPRRLYEHGRQMGRELVAAGFNWNLAPVLDVHALEQGIMRQRSLGSDPVLVGQLALAYCRGLADAQCLACGKHFPGLGRTTLDTHKLGVKVNLSREELEQMELIPFNMAIAAAIPGLMVSHAVFRCLDEHKPASLSPVVIQGLLRQQLGYQGLVMSDDLEMQAIECSPAQAAAAAYAAGNDLLLICSQSEQAIGALQEFAKQSKDGVFTEKIVDNASRRIQRLKLSLPPLGPLSLLERLLENYADNSGLSVQD
jgi:beta-N-acetylhexosaminidase